MQPHNLSGFLTRKLGKMSLAIGLERTPNPYCGPLPGMRPPECSELTKLLSQLEYCAILHRSSMNSGLFRLLIHLTSTLSFFQSNCLFHQSITIVCSLAANEIRYRKCTLFGRGVLGTHGWIDNILTVSISSSTGYLAVFWLGSTKICFFFVFYYFRQSHFIRLTDIIKLNVTIVKKMINVINILKM